MKTFGYVRISTIEQRAGFGIESQTASIKNYCEVNDLPEPEIVEEQGSGESLAARIELQLLLAKAEDLVEAGEEVVVVFHKLDRLSRHQIEQEAVIVKSFRTGVRFASTDMTEADLLRPEYQDDPMRVAMRQIIGVFNQLERGIIQARLDGGLAVKASKGGFTGGRLPLGYKSVEQEMVIDEDVAPAIRRVFYLKKAHVTNSTILALCARDYPCCKSWSRSYISNILKKEALYCRGEYKPRGGSQTFTLPNLIIVHEDDPDPAPAEVDPDSIDWDKVSDQVNLKALALLLNMPDKKLKDLTLSNGISVAWKGSATTVPKPVARAIAELSKEES